MVDRERGGIGKVLHGRQHLSDSDTTLNTLKDMLLNVLTVGELLCHVTKVPAFGSSA